MVDLNGLLFRLCCRCVSYRRRKGGPFRSRVAGIWMQSNAITLQRAWRAFLTRRSPSTALQRAACSARRERGAARRLSRWFRHCCCFKRLFLRPRRQRAALLLQASVPRHLARLRARRLALRLAAAKAVQRVWRGFLGRQRFRRQMNWVLHWVQLQQHWVAPAPWLCQRPSLEWQNYQWKKNLCIQYIFSPLSFPTTISGLDARVAKAPPWGMSRC